MHYLIIGAGPAAVNAAEHLRGLDPASEITLLAAEGVPPYSRMALPYFLVGDVKAEGTHLRKNSTHFEEMNIAVRYGWAVDVNTADKLVTLHDGATVSYDKLLLAAGSTATRPPIPGIDHAAVHNCWTLPDAEQIMSTTAPGTRVVLMGAGFIGCIILEALARRKVDLTVIEMEDRMVARMTNETLGNMIKDWCIKEGVKVMTSTQVSEIREAGGALEVLTSGGDTVPADVVICATGVRPNVAFLQGSGIDVNHGVVVDDYLRTSQADVYAAGDIAQGLDMSTGDYEVQAIQPTAVEHGRIAAMNMALGDVHPHAGNLNMNVLDTLGAISTSFGLWMGVEGGEQAEYSNPERFEYLNLQFQGDKLVGASSLGMTDHIGVMRGLIQSGQALGPWKEKLLQNPTLLSEAYLASVQSQDAALMA